MCMETGQEDSFVFGGFMIKYWNLYAIACIKTAVGDMVVTTNTAMRYQMMHNFMLENITLINKISDKHSYKKYFKFKCDQNYFK